MIRSMGVQKKLLFVIAGHSKKHELSHSKHGRQALWKTGAPSLAMLLNEHTISSQSCWRSQWKRLSQMLAAVDIPPEFHDKIKLPNLKA